MLVKEYGVDPEAARPAPAVVLHEMVTVMAGNPDPDKISTSYVERLYLTMRKGMRRFTRLTNGQGVGEPLPPDPGDGPGLADQILTREEIAALLD